MYQVLQAYALVRFAVALRTTEIRLTAAPEEQILARLHVLPLIPSETFTFIPFERRDVKRQGLHVGATAAAGADCP